MTQYGFAFIGTRCTGCKTCMLSCKDYNDLNPETDYRKVYEYGGGSCRIAENGTIEDTTFVYYVSSACNHCERPSCVQVCPTGAMHKDSDTGLVSVDKGKCIGCGYCAMSCPYSCPSVDRSKGHSVKCDGCINRVKEGKKPICVEACPLRALDFGEIGELVSKYEGVRSIAPLPSPDLTGPSVVIVKPPKAIESGSSAGSILNLKEVL